MTREEAIKELEQRLSTLKFIGGSYVDCVNGEAIEMAIEALKQQEILTYYEQCIFLAAMGREKKLCEKIEKNPDSPSKYFLTFICEEIERKVKATLWRREE